MKKFLKSCTTALAAMLFAACGADPSVNGDQISQKECANGDCGGTVMIDTKFGVKPGALIDGGTCTGEGDDAPCIAAYEKNKAEHQYDHACLPDDPEPQCKSANGVWGCYMYTLDQCPTAPKCTTNSQCNDGKSCTEDLCNIDTGDCIHTPTFGSCEDGDMCTVGDMCGDSGECVPGDMTDYDDGLYCNGLETCDPATGLEVDGEDVVCTDTDLCDGTLACSEEELGACVNGAAPEAPVDDEVCSNPVCDPATGVWGWVWEENGTACDGGNCSTSDECWGGVCTPTAAGYDGGDAACALKPVDQMACLISWDYCDPLGEYMTVDVFKDADGCVWQYKANGAPCDGQGSGYVCMRPEGSSIPVCVPPPT